MDVAKKICICLMLNQWNVHASTNGTCNAVQRSLSGGKLIYFKSNFCCDNFEKINGICKACMTGFTSKLGGTCYQCSYPFYGYRCAGLCQCTDNQRCHNVHGCIEVSGEMTSKQETFPTEMYSTQGNSRKMLPWTTDSRDLTSRIVMIPSTDTALGIINTAVFIYTLCGVSIFLILSFSCVCFCVHIKLKKRKNNINRNIDINQHINVNGNGNNGDDDIEISQLSSTERETGHDYEEIDERQMSTFLAISSSNQQDIDDGNSSESSDGIRLPTDGYLNPYHPLQFMLQQSENNQEHSNGYNPPVNENMVYTNLYQSLNLSREDQLRLYARCHSVQYLELVDEPLKNKNDQSIKEYSKRFVKTL